MLLSSAIVHPMLPAADIARAKRFYGEVLRLDMIDEKETVLAYQSGQGTVLFVYPSPNAGTNNATAAEFEVADLEATVNQLKSDGSLRSTTCLV
jgi:predicted enzyme related to lactoylglutathione lyase